MNHHQAVINPKRHHHLYLFGGYDLWLLFTVLFILALGLLMVLSASINISYDQFNDPYHYFRRQLYAAILGLSIAAIVLKVPMQLWEKYSFSMLLLGILALGLVLIPDIGHKVNGSYRWIKIGSLSFQPSELMKICLIAYIANYLVHQAELVKSNFQTLLPPIIVSLVVSILLLFEPDYGSIVILTLTGIGMLLLGGMPVKQFFMLSLVMFGIFVGLILIEPYRMERLIAFTNPWGDPYDSGFQLTQALIAFGRGEWWGSGLGSSIQKMFYLPEAHTDFIFAVLAEELGFIGVIMVIVLFTYLIWRALVIANVAMTNKQYFSAYFAYGIGIMVGIQAYINMGVNMGILPTKGLTLPMISYGSNSLLVYCILMGVLLRIEYESRHGVVGDNHAS